MVDYHYHVVNHNPVVTIHVSSGKHKVVSHVTQQGIDGEHHIVDGYQSVVVRVGRGEVRLSSVIITKADNASAIEAIRKPATNPAIFYDLTGRRLNGVPTRPGIYISNGKKVLY